MHKGMSGLWVGVMAAMAGLAQASPAEAAVGAAALSPSRPVEHCSAWSVEKRFTRADPGFDPMRHHINRMAGAAGGSAALAGATSASPGISADAGEFRVRLEYARCDSLQPVAGLPPGLRDTLAKDCAEAQCEDPAPGLGAPNGSVMIIFTCANGVAREVEYEKVNGVWRVKSSRQEHVVSCPLPRDGEGGEDPEPEPDKG